MALKQILRMAHLFVGLLFFIVFLSCSKQFNQENPYLLSSKIVESLERFRGNEPQQLACFNYSYIGEYTKTLEIWDNLMGKTTETSIDDSIYFVQFKPINARNFIVKQAKSNRIVVINEAHHQPMHRVFTTGLLKELYDLGYKYLAVEDLNRRDSFLSKRKYPTTESGYFIKEPQFGNLIREALNLGFSLVPYDFATENIYEDREKNAAENIKKIMDKDPLAKIVIHCGYDHVFESETSIGKPMAQYLAEQTGINPLTIDQENYTERSEKSYESPFLRLSKITESSIYLDSSGHVFSGRRKQKKVDIKVFHPHSNYYFDRPNWLISTQSKKWYFLPIGKIKIAFPILIQVYKKGENSSGIPIDIIEILNAKSRKPLALYNGDFNFKIINSQNQEQVLRIKVE